MPICEQGFEEADVLIEALGQTGVDHLLRDARQPRQIAEDPRIGLARQS